MKRCKVCGRPIPDWAEVCPGCAEIRVEEVMAVVFYETKETKDRVYEKDFTDALDDPIAEARRFFDKVDGSAVLVVKVKDSWRRIAEK